MRADRTEKRLQVNSTNLGEISLAVLDYLVATLWRYAY
jgi:hypothetical protein